MASLACSIVVSNWNGRSHLERCLPCLRAQTYSPLELIVADNGSTDGSLELLRDGYPDVRVVELGDNLGFATANDRGIQAASGTYVALLNNDTEPEPAWLEELVACLERHPDAASVTSKMMLVEPPGTIDGAGDVLDWSFLPHPRGHGEPDHGQYDDEVEVFSASGGAALWRGDLLRQLGGFDESFFIYYEDVDLGLRARQLGHSCWYAPRSVVLHHRGAATKGLTVFELYHPVKNRWFLILKNTPARLLLRHLRAIAGGELIWWRRAFASRHPGALLRAYATVLRNLPRLMRQRRAIARSRLLSVANLDRVIGGIRPDGPA
jgi:GT2 family glycosyltransferase